MSLRIACYTAAFVHQLQIDVSNGDEHQKSLQWGKIKKRRLLGGVTEYAAPQSQLSKKDLIESVSAAIFYSFDMFVEYL